MATAAAKPFGLGRKDAGRTKNMFALGLLCWLYSRDTSGTIDFLKTKFASKPEIRDANLAAFRAGHAYGETIEVFEYRYYVVSAPMKPGCYRQITGNLATAYGLMVGVDRAGMQLFLESYPLHHNHRQNCQSTIRESVCQRYKESVLSSPIPLE